MESEVTLPAPSLARIATRDAYQAARTHIFTTPTSLEWFVRQHRAELVSANALLRINGRLQIDEVAFDQAVLEIGRAQVEARLA